MNREPIDKIMPKKRGILTVVVGLPGSGKSRLLTVLRKAANGTVTDDFMRNIDLATPIQRDPSVTDSRAYPTLIVDLRNGKRCVISDIIFCDTLVRAQLEIAVRADVPNIRIIWEFFENNRAACEANARRRGRKQTLDRELKMIRFLSAKYFVPLNVKAHKVWKPPGRVATASKRPKKRTASG